MSGNVFWSMGGYARYVWPCFGMAVRGAGLESVVGAPLSWPPRTTAGAPARWPWRRSDRVMTPRRKRLFVVLGILGGVAASVSLAVMASRENIMFYYDPQPGGRRARRPPPSAFGSAAWWSRAAWSANRAICRCASC